MPSTDFSMELRECGTNGLLKRQNTHMVNFHETKQKLFRFARAKDKRVVDLKKELKSLTKEEQILSMEEKTRLDDHKKELESLTKEEKTKLGNLRRDLESLPCEDKKKLRQNISIQIPKDSINKLET